jgi:hypothetical protein
MMANKRPRRNPQHEYSSALFVRCPPELPAAITRAAEREMTTASAYVRSAVIDKLRRDGVDPCEVAV